MPAVLKIVLDITPAPFFARLGRLKEMAVGGCGNDVGVRLDPSFRRWYMGGNNRILLHNQCNP